MSGPVRISQVKWGSFVLDGGAMFGIIPRPLWEAKIPPDERNGIRLALRSLIVRAQDRVVLVDCGIWEYFPEKLRTKVYSIQQGDFRTTLNAQAGLDLEDVTDVIATHLHFDHAGGFLVRSDGGLVPRFPNAVLHVQKSQLDWAADPSDKDRGSYVTEFMEGLRNLSCLAVHDGPWSPVPGIFVEVAHGHTPGMQIVRATAADKTIIHTADMVPTSAHVPTPYIMAYDNEPVTTAREKRCLFSTWPDAIFFFEHDPEQPFWTVAWDGREYRPKAMAAPPR